jgi:Fur family peroxide stress response transcriptional regulator
MDSKHQTSRLERLTSDFAATALAMTPQRRALLEVLASREDHPTVDQIYAALAVKIPEVSRTTVYRSVEALAGHGVLNRVEHPGSSVRFDPNVDPHHHFLCSACGALTDLPDAAISGTPDLSYVGKGIGIADELTVLVRGRCLDCAK